MANSYCPFMGKKGRAWGELDLPGIAGRVAGSEPRTPPEVESAAQALAAACKKAGVDLEAAKSALEEAFKAPVVSEALPARISGRSRRR